MIRLGRSVVTLKRLSILALNLFVGVSAFACGEDTTTTTVPTTTTSTSTATDTTTTTTTSSQTTTLLPSDLIERVAVITETPTVDELVEIGLYEPTNDLRIRSLVNPYDYDVLSLTMTFTKPSGETFDQLAFWYREYAELWVMNPVYDANGYLLSGTENLRWKTDGISHYMVRLMPKEAGSWTYRLVVNVQGRPIQSLEGGFDVQPKTERSNGIIQVDPGNPRNFRFADSLQSYYPIGLNLGWYGKLGTQDFFNWFKHLNAVNANQARLWMAPWSFSLHTTSMDDFDTRQNMAIRLDKVFDKAQEYGIYLQLALLNHGQFSAVTNPTWGNNPYNSANGGILDHPIQFFTNLEARRIYKNEVRYIVARYGYSEHLMAWELFNEVDWIDGYNPLIVSRWHKDIAEFIKAIDPYGHMITTSYKTVSHTDAYAYEAFDFVSVHTYDYHNTPFYAKLLSETAYLRNKYVKPILFGEIGIEWRSGNGTYLLDHTGITIRQGAWGGLMGGGAGAASHWWWDTWVEKYNLWHNLQGAAKYSQLMNLSGKAYSELRLDPSLVISEPKAKLMGYRTDDAIYGYLYHVDWNHYQASPDALGPFQVSLASLGPVVRVRWFDALTGELMSTEIVATQDGSITLSISSLSSDVAFIVDTVQ